MSRVDQAINDLVAASAAIFAQSYSERPGADEHSFQTIDGLVARGLVLSHLADELLRRSDPLNEFRATATLPRGVGHAPDFLDQAFDPWVIQPAPFPGQQNNFVERKMTPVPFDDFVIGIVSGDPVLNLVFHFHGKQAPDRDRDQEYHSDHDP